MNSIRKSAKKAPTYYTSERVGFARENLDRYDWAKKTFDRIRTGDEIRYYIGPQYGPADTFLDQSDDFVWMLQPTTTIGRVLPQESKAICPVHGTAVRAHSAWCPYNIDPFSHPYKIQCMEGGEWYPSNDYLAGDMTSGDFPDDGEGFERDGTHFYLLREYAHMVYGSVVIPSLRSLSQAYAITGDAKYGRKGAVLLARLASEYPNHDDRQDRLYFAKYGGRSPQYAWKTGGMITDLIWETFELEGAVYAYDGLFPYLDQDPDLIAFLKGKGLPIDSGDDLRSYIEHYLLQAGMTGLLNGNIRGNEGHHQASALACALVLDDYEGASPNSVDMVDYAYHGSGHSAYVLVNGLQRDGGGHESPGYNQIKLDFVRVNDAMAQIRNRRPEQFPTDRYPDIFDNPKARALFDTFIDLTIADRTMPAIGDSGGIGPPSRSERSRYSNVGSENLYAFKRYGDPRYARAFTDLDGTTMGGELFEEFPEEAIRTALESPQSIIDRSARLLDGYGVGILESGREPHRRAVSLNYSGIIGHRQQDNLVLELFARGVDLLPDLGYPTLWEWFQRWDANSLAHNTVTVDETQPRRDIGGVCRLFGSRNGVHVISSSHDPYPPFDDSKKARPDSPPTDLYERTVVLVDVDDDRFYVVDLFAVNGGEQHDQSWHGLLKPIESPDLEWQTQDSGTLAGPDVELFGSWTDRWGRERDDFPGFLKEIRTADLSEPSAWTWETELPEGDTVRLHVVPVGDGMRVISGRGRSPARPDDWWLDYILCRRESSDGNRSLFLSVIDGFQSETTVTGVKLLSELPLILEITRPDGKDMVHLNIPEDPSRTTDHRPLGIRVMSHTDGNLTRDIRIGEWDRESGSGYVEGTIAKVDYRNDRIAVDLTSADSLAPGRGIRIYNEGRSAMYRIESLEQIDGRLWLTLDATALLAMGPAEEASNGQLKLRTHLTFANGRLTDDGDLAPGRDYFAGSWLGEGSEATTVRGAVHGGDGNTSIIFLQDEIDDDILQERYGDRVVTLWQHGIGDRVEIAQVNG